jgi:hypothetical protein
MIVTATLLLCMQAHAAAQTEQKLGLINTQDIEERAQMLLMDDEFVDSADPYDYKVWAEPLDLHERIEIGYEPNAQAIDRLVAFYLSMPEDFA